MRGNLMSISIFTAIVSVASSTLCMTCDGPPCLERQHQTECADMFCVTSHVFLPDTRLQVTKRCVSEDVCRGMANRLSESTRCQRLYSESVIINLFHRIQYRDLQCDFCCIGSMCNVDYYPPQLYSIDNVTLDSQIHDGFTKDNAENATMDKKAQLPESLAAPDSIETSHFQSPTDLPLSHQTTHLNSSAEAEAETFGDKRSATQAPGSVEVRNSIVPETPDVITQKSTTTDDPKNNRSNDVSTTKCWSCEGPGCPNVQTQVGCHSGLCMTSLTHFSDYRPREVTKKCAEKQECLQKWWIESSDTHCVNMLMEKMDVTGNDIACHYCCYGNMCNEQTYPEAETLVEPSMLL